MRARFSIAIRTATRTGGRTAGRALAAGLLLLAGTGAAVAQPAPSSDPVIGYWLTENRRAIVEIRPCADSVCGHLVWLAEPTDETGRPKTDAENRTLCGLKLIGAFMQSRPGEWSEGFIYNPRSGGRYSAWLEAQGPDRLEVGGYVGISLLGKSQTWTRLAHDRGGC